MKLFCGGKEMEFYLTFDLELWSKRKNYNLDISKALRYIKLLSEKKNVPVTIFVSLSRKYNIINLTQKEYLKKIKSDLEKNKSRFTNFQMHMHAFEINNRAQFDDLDNYKKRELIEILKTGKDVLEDIIKEEVYAFRSGGFKVGNKKTFFYALDRSKFRVDSSIIDEERRETEKIIRENGINVKEYYLTTIKSILGKKSYFCLENYTILPKIINIKKERIVSHYHSFKVLNNSGDITKRFFLLHRAIRILRNRGYSFRWL